MPTEHEYKTVLTLDIPLFLKVQENARRKLNIEQGYLKGVRVRCTTVDGENDGQWVLTFKHRDESEGRVIEVQKDLDRRDGEGLWRSCQNTLKKTRYEVPFNGHLCEFDYFHDPERGGYYFALCEIEVDEGSPRPALPEWARRYVIYEPVDGDERFSNRRLSDIFRTRKLYDELMPKPDEFREAIKRASAEVATWPEWKRRCLGKIDY